MEKSNQSIGFALQGIKTEQFAVFEENYTHKKAASLDTALQFRLSPESRHIGVFLTSEFIQTKKIFLKLAISCHFKIEDKAWERFLQKEVGKLMVPKDSLVQMATITVGTARGILFAKAEATQFSKFILPTLNLAEMVKADAGFDLEIDSK